MPPSAGKKPLEWARRAREAFAASLDYIASDDPFTAKQVAERVDKALALIQEQPEIGAPAAARGRRTFAIPNTGHSINYRETRYNCQEKLSLPPVKKATVLPSARVKEGIARAKNLRA